VAFAAVALCVAAACSAGGDATAKRKTSGTATTSTPSSTTTLGRPSDQQVLAAVVLAPHDLAAGDTVETVTDGDVVTDNVSLDLCNAAFPSEARRRARHQVEAVAGAPSTRGLAVEAILYDSPDGSSQAFAELRAAQQRCPATFVPSNIDGVPPLKTTFGPSPDITWPPTAGIDRLAFSTLQVAQTGETDGGIAVYQRRGRLLVGLYVAGPDRSAAAINPMAAGIEGLGGRIAQRMMMVPAGAVEGPPT
jgi:hypothetical protein